MLHSRHRLPWQGAATWGNPMPLPHGIAHSVQAAGVMSCALAAHRVQQYRTDCPPVQFARELQAMAVDTAARRNLCALEADDTPPLATLSASANLPRATMHGQARCSAARQEARHSHTTQHSSSSSRACIYTCMHTPASLGAAPSWCATSPKCTRSTHAPATPSTLTPHHPLGQWPARAVSQLHMPE
jgi:hypothetical protein